MELRHQARQRFINDVAFGAAANADTLVLVCECGRSDCHDFISVQHTVFAELASNPSPRVLTARCAGSAEIGGTPARSPYLPN